MKRLYPNLDILLMDSSASDQPYETGGIFKRASQYIDLIQSKVIVTTHGPLIKTKKNITIELWHAFPTKKESALNNKRARKRIKRLNKMTDCFVSYSDFSTLLYNSRYGMPTRKYVVLGAPRNDYLFSEIADPYHREYKKVIIYAPTFRESKTEGERLTLDFWFEKFSSKDFYRFLLQNNYLFIWKLHPNEERRWKSFEQDNIPSNLLILTDSKLRDMNVDFYQLLSLTDLLITDYSSIYADYLLLDKPMIFIPADIGKFDEERGLLLSPYDTWMPGPKCHDQNELQEEIGRSLSDDNYYRKERNFLRDVFHRYQDGKSTDRVIEFILSKLEK
jgi:CDP-glycerol glycerophosphotransferase (TagB/SpsB family)